VSGAFFSSVCKTPLFASRAKFDSGTGWPSFYDKLAAVELETGVFFFTFLLLLFSS